MIVSCFKACVYRSKCNGGKLTLIDGHLRKDYDPEQEWNVQITDLTDEEADLLISMLDPIAGMATMDANKFLALSEEIVTDDWRVREALRKVSKVIGKKRIKRMVDAKTTNRTTLSDSEKLEIENAVAEIRGSTGWGKIEIVFQNGDMTDMEVNVKCKLKQKSQ